MWGWRETATAWPSESLKANSESFRIIQVNHSEYCCRHVIIFCYIKWCIGILIKSRNEVWQWQLPELLQSKVANRLLADPVKDAETRGHLFFKFQRLLLVNKSSICTESGFIVLTLLCNPCSSLWRSIPAISTLQADHSSVINPWSLVPLRSG